MNDHEKRLIVWTDYGYEGWKPEGFDTEEEAIRHLLSESSGRRVLTQRMELSARLVEPRREGESAP